MRKIPELQFVEDVNWMNTIYPHPPETAEECRVLKSLLDSAEHRTVPLSMNRPFGVPALAGSDRLKAELQTSGVPTGRFMVRMQISQERHWS